MKSIVLISNTSKSFWLFRRKIIEALIKKKYKVYLLSNKDKYIKNFKKYKIIFKKINNKFNSYNPINFLFLFCEIFFHIKKIKPSLIQSYTIIPNLISPLIAKILKLKSYVMITGLGSFFYQANIIKIFFLKFLYKIILNLSDCIILTNNIEKKLIKKIIFLKKIKIIKIPGAGVDLKYFNNSLKNIIKNKKIIKIKKKIHGSFIILFVGRLIKDKGILDFIKITEILRYRKDIHFIIIGKEDSNNPTNIFNIKEKITKLRNITYIPEFDDMRQIYKISDLLVFPSYGEGMPTVVMEASSMGIPSIVYNVNGCSEAVKNNYNGFIVKKKDINAVIKKIIYLKSNLNYLKLIKRKCIIQSKKKFDQNRLIKKLIRLY